MDMMQQMYIGPTIPGVVKKGTVFLGALPKSLTTIEEKIPSIKYLIIPIEKITEVTKALSEQGSTESVSYGRILEFLKGGNEHVYL